MSLPSSFLRRLRQAIDASRTRGRSRAPVELVDLERPRFFSGQLLSAEDLALDQVYFREKLRRHNRQLHGWGIVSGLEVEAAGGCMVAISPGYALDAYGDEIVVPGPARLDVCKSGALIEGRTGYLAVRFVEHGVSPVASEETGSEHTRTREGFELAVLTELPSDLGEAPWVLLAGVTVLDGEASIEADAHRRYAANC